MEWRVEQLSCALEDKERLLQQQRVQLAESAQREAEAASRVSDLERLLADVRREAVLLGDRRDLQADLEERFGDSERANLQAARLGRELERERERATSTQRALEFARERITILESGRERFFAKLIAWQRMGQGQDGADLAQFIAELRAEVSRLSSENAALTDREAHLLRELQGLRDRGVEIADPEPIPSWTPRDAHNADARALDARSSDVHPEVRRGGAWVRDASPRASAEPAPRVVAPGATGPAPAGPAPAATAPEVEQAFDWANGSAEPGQRASILGVELRASDLDGTRDSTPQPRADSMRQAHADSAPQPHADSTRQAHADSSGAVPPRAERVTPAGETGSDESARAASLASPPGKLDPEIAAAPLTFSEVRQQLRSSLGTPSRARNAERLLLELFGANAALRKGAARALLHLAGEFAAPSLSLAFHAGTDAEERVELLGLMARTGAVQVGPAIRTAQGDADPKVRAAALDALAQHVRCDVASLRGPLESALSDRDARVRRRAVMVLCSLPRSEAAPLLARVLEDPDPQLRRAACAGLSQVDSPAIQRLLAGVLLDPELFVRRAAAAALRPTFGPEVLRIADASESQRRRQVASLRERLAKRESRDDVRDESPLAELASARASRLADVMARSRRVLERGGRAGGVPRRSVLAAGLPRGSQ